MFAQSENFVEEHCDRIGIIAVSDQESNNTTWKLAGMNLAIRGIDANLGLRNGDSFGQDLHPTSKTISVSQTHLSTYQTRFCQNCCRPSCASLAAPN
jgi:type I restriction-modification system DNA methylase subunit